MRGCNVNDKGIETLSTNLKEMITLSNLAVSLDLSGEIGQIHRLDHIFLALKNLTDLSVLNLGFDMCHNLCEVEIKTTSSYFGFLTSLRRLKLSFKFYNRIADDGIDYLTL